jgi:hypothetical protein
VSWRHVLVLAAVLASGTAMAAEPASPREQPSQEQPPPTPRPKASAPRGTSPELSQEDAEVVENLELLESMETVEDLELLLELSQEDGSTGGE